MEKVSYALGLSIGNNLTGSGIKDVNLEKFMQGVSDVLQQKTTEMSYDEAKTVLDAYFQELASKMQALNQQIGVEFLAENKQKAGVVELPSGLQYQILTEGTGDTPSAADQVECHYHGTMLNGQVFDSSVERGEPAVFGVGQVIAGWVEALQLMKEGSKWRLFIPSQLAYGERGAGEAIPPFATLIFDVELLKVIK
ncbi:MAG: FKBP-type peptidyl-prolyl cis-trans isomerase [Paludibacteraceae bacterium]|nr:FKBP-type peptidyl-prolyl cis-trans isomerase [Paludibacteraceae bacterium]MBP6285010.1 FKBP-type peptidyl-prolyl cis-trans isomerase [Paludibacteraceae bacterium]